MSASTFMQIRQRLTAVALCLIAAGASADAQGTKPDDTLILYTGIGYVSETAQPHLADLLTSPDPRFAEAGDHLIDTLGDAAKSRLQKDQLRKWTSHPIVSSPEEVDAILSERLGREATDADRKRIFEIFDEVYAVTFVGGLEYTAQQQTSFGQAAQEQMEIASASPLWHQYSYSSMSAILFDLNRSEVIASASETGFRQSTMQKTSLDQLDPALILAQTYGDAGIKAVDLLGDLLDRMPPGKRKMVAGESRYVVTNAWLEQTAGPALDLFEWTPAPKPNGLLCERPTQCANGDGPCNKLTALLVHGMTAALSRAGLMTEPPLSSHWREGAAESALVNLSLGRLQESPIELRVLKVPQEANSADIKIVPTMETAANHTTIRPGNPPFEVNTWASELSYVRATTDPATCRITQAEKVAGRAFGKSPSASYAAGSVSVSADQNRLQIFLAVEDALTREMPKSLKAEHRK